MVRIDLFITILETFFHFKILDNSIALIFVDSIPTVITTKCTRIITTHQCPPLFNCYLFHYPLLLILHSQSFNTISPPLKKSLFNPVHIQLPLFLSQNPLQKSALKNHGSKLFALKFVLVFFQKLFQPTLLC